MDVNRTRHHLLNGAHDFIPLLAARPDCGLWWREESQSVLLAPQVLCLPAPGQADLLTPDERRGACFDHYGNIYWIDAEEKTIRYRPAASPHRAGDFWSTANLCDSCPEGSAHGDFKPVAPSVGASDIVLRGLTVTAHEYLVAGTLAPAGLLVFDLHAGGPPSWLQWPDQVPFTPFDLTAAPDGGLWVLDRGTPARCWRLDRFFRVVACDGALTEISPPAGDIFKNLTGATRTRPARQFPSGIRLDLTAEVHAADALAIEALPDGSILILDNDTDGNASVIRRLKNGAAVAAVTLDAGVIGRLLPVAAIRGHDMVFVPSPQADAGAVAGALYVSAVQGTQTFQFALRAEGDDLELALQPPLLAMREHGGKALAASQGTVYYDFNDRWLPLAEQPRRRYMSRGNLSGIVLDGKTPGCVWHRLMVDACIPEGTRVSVESRCAEQRDLLVGETFRPEPDLYLRAGGSEIALHRPFLSEDVPAGTGTWELLLQNARGRFIELRLSLTGTGRTTPLIRALRVYYPRFSYLNHYLPAVYRDDELSAAFLDRFLANVEGLYSDLEGRIEQAQALLDTRTAPPEYLEWLAGWLGAIWDPAWDDHRRRLFLDHAELLYRWRGTQIGMRAAIRLSSDECPDAAIFEELKDQREHRLGALGGRHVRIVEQFLTRRMPGITLGATDQNPTHLGFGTAQAPWDPTQGPHELHRRFQNFLTDRYGGGDPVDAIVQLQSTWESAPDTLDQILFPPLLPQCEAKARDWVLFTRDRIGFTYAAVTKDDLPLYREFLARRYRGVEQLNVAYLKSTQTGFKAFTGIGLPTELPAGQALADWIAFVSLAVPIQRNAHRFRVLVPTRLGELPESRARRKARVREIVQREKPAHTDFDVGMYWALFQVGSARVGLDTTIGEGSRFAALVLGQNYMGQGFLAHGHPWCVGDRTVVGRDRL